MELPIVIAIFVIMLAILTPVFQQARKYAHLDACMTRMHVVGMAMKLYAQDYDEMPLANVTFQASPEKMLEPYNSDTRYNKDLCQCPRPWDAIAQGRYRFRDVPAGKKPVITPESVIAYCVQHLDNDGKTFEWNKGRYIVVRASGAASVVSAEKVTRWRFQNNQWTEENNDADLSGYVTICFPKETCPPQTKEISLGSARVVFADAPQNSVKGSQ
jgi:type II secretory pathway pseudopilin PulG